MAITLIVKGNNLEVQEHKDILGRSFANQHPIMAITGLEDALNNLERLALMVNEHQNLGNLEKPNQHPIPAITGLQPLIELFLRDLTNIFVIDIDNPLIKRTEYQNIRVHNGYYYMMPIDGALESFVDYKEYNSTLPATIVNDYRQVVNSTFTINIAKTIQNYLDIFKEYKDSTKLVSSDTTVSNIGGVINPWWMDNKPNAPLIYYTFTTPFYINRLVLSLRNVKYSIKTIGYNGEESIIADQGQAIDDETTNVYLINEWITRLEINTGEYVDPSVTEFLVSYLALVIKDEFGGRVRYRIELGYIFDDPAAVQILGSSSITPKIELIEHNELSGLVDLEISLSSVEQQPIPIEDIQVSYHQRIGATIQDIYKRFIDKANEYTNFYAETVLLLEKAQEIVQDIVDPNKFGALKNKVEYSFDNISSAIGLVNPDTGMNYADLNERLLAIESKYFDAYRQEMTRILETYGIADQHMTFKVVTPINSLNLTFEYPVGTYRLKVYLDGMKLECGQNHDYIEDSSSSIKFNYTIAPVPSLDNTIQPREITVEYLALNPIIQTDGSGRSEVIYMPKMLRVPYEVRVAGTAAKAVAIPIGINQCNIKNISVRPDKQCQFVVKLYSNQDSKYPVFESRLVTDNLYEMVDIIYYDEHQSCTLYLVIENKYGLDTTYNIIISGIALDSAGYMDEAYNQLLADNLNDAGTKRFEQIEGQIREIVSSDKTDEIVTKISSLDSRIADVSTALSETNTKGLEIKKEVRTNKRSISQLDNDVTELTERLDTLALTGGQTDTITGEGIMVRRDGEMKFVEELDMHGNKIINLGDPEIDTDAVNLRNAGKKVRIKSISITGPDIVYL